MIDTTAFFKMCSTFIICHAVLSGSSYNEERNDIIFLSTFPKRPFGSRHSRNCLFEQNTLYDEVGGAQGTLQELLDVFPYTGFIKSGIVSTGTVTDASVELAASIWTLHQHRCENLTWSTFWCPTIEESILPRLLITYQFWFISLCYIFYFCVVYFVAFFVSCKCVCVCVFDIDMFHIQLSTDKYWMRNVRVCMCVCIYLSTYLLSIYIYLY